VTEDSGEKGPGTLFVVATPIGNLADITLRALDVLRSVDRIAAEDTRRTRKLLSFYDIHKPLVSYHGHNIQKRGPELIARMLEGEDIALVTDAGTPGISDPGALLISQALEKDLAVSVIPGPAALITALVGSGLPTHPFAFLGFAPGRGAGRRRFFTRYSSLPMTVILYESPQRLHATLQDILRIWGDRRIAVARELTKKFEEVFRGKVSEAADHFAEGVRGELTLVVEGAEEETGEVEEKDWREDLQSLLDVPGTSVKEAVRRIMERHGLPRRMVYREAVDRRKEE